MQAARAVGQTILAQFVEAGAVPVEADILQPAEALLDLYGEDIRGRAFVTHDPIRGEMMLRPDFTVPVVQTHMREGAEPARYAYLGEVFRKQDHRGAARQSEYLQAGFEVFDRVNPQAADAEVFALFARILAPLNLTATIGDIGLLTASVEALDTIPARKRALLRHIWRPQRFHALLKRYAGQLPMPAARQAVLDGGTASEMPWIGLRSEAEVAARIERLREDAAAAPIAAHDMARLDALFALRCPALEAPAKLRALGLPEAAVERFEARLAALQAQGVDLGGVRFEASHGRTTMEYYDGFVFTFKGHDDMPPVATGGRYDALTKVLGQGLDVPAEIPAVGGVIRPALVAALGGLS
ncbi:ATP phosphoribosyltransferase regulatory subunit [Albirhodobacter sp. R86504]|jgi:ATP phosphoribosyltransferase regulatory subunit|uniref:ATP phosphoribosyltransferase regulatory subunit n=1 Tax=Albirhodobacter sp. R86504 TaxID=3093848 RepID=UPI0036735ED9